jgi:hypothetical protein
VRGVLSSKTGGGTGRQCRLLCVSGVVPWSEESAGACVAAQCVVSSEAYSGSKNRPNVWPFWKD